MDSLAPACPAVAALERRPPPPATGQFKRDYRRESRGRHGAFLDSSLVPVVEILANDHPLEARHHDHGLSGEWRDHRDCHVKPDLVLTRTTARGSLEFRPGALRDARRGPGRRCRPEPEMPRMTGLELAAELARQDRSIRVIVLTTFGRPRGTCAGRRRSRLPAEGRSVGISPPKSVRCSRRRRVTHTTDCVDPLTLAFGGCTTDL